MFCLLGCITTKTQVAIVSEVLCKECVVHNSAPELLQKLDAESCLRLHPVFTTHAVNTAVHY